MRKISLPVMFAVAMMLVGLPLAMALKPTHFIADSKPMLVLEKVVPITLPNWQELKNFQAIVPDPTVRAVIEATYSQTLTRGFINGNGQIMLLTIAYGRDQNSESTAAHRPEFCYAGAGFQMTQLGTKLFNLGNNQLTVRHMLAQRAAYQEKISYWVTLDETATLPGMGRKLAQIRYGLSGRIADGMLVRLSSPNMSDEEALKMHAAFLAELHDAISPGFRSRIFGV